MHFILSLPPLISIRFQSFTVFCMIKAAYDYFVSIFSLIPNFSLMIFTFSSNYFMFDLLDFFDSNWIRLAFWGFYKKFWMLSNKLSLLISIGTSTFFFYFSKNLWLLKFTGGLWKIISYFTFNYFFAFSTSFLTANISFFFWRYLFSVEIYLYYLTRLS